MGVAEAVHENADGVINQIRKGGELQGGLHPTGQDVQGKNSAGEDFHENQNYEHKTPGVFRCPESGKNGNFGEKEVNQYAANP